ncbi:hypothetical protein ACJRO7_027816 [Eucalyptus globulus]|uniref:Uncharacterized protein n=1 Tax=Eucalyptus globulus TaxID=34317 RepID=A0ABD3JXM1_EUCGL
MERRETVTALETHYGIDPALTRVVWDRLVTCNWDFFQEYFLRLVVKRQIVRFNQLLEQQHRAMSNLPVPVQQQQQTPMELDETAPQADTPLSGTTNENEAECKSLPPNPVSFVGSEDGSEPNLVLGSSLAQSSSEGPEMRIDAAPDAAHMQISQVPNLIAGGDQAANFGGPVQHSSLATQSLSHLDSNREGPDQKDRANFASGQGSPSADL